MHADRDFMVRWASGLLATVGIHAFALTRVIDHGTMSPVIIQSDEVIIELQKKLKKLSNDELENTFWEIETGEFVNNGQIKELEQERDQMIKSLDLKNKDNVHKILMDFCKKYEELCIIKYPDAPLPLEILKSIN